MARELLEHLDVAGQTGTGERPLEEVMTEEGVLGDPAMQGGLEGVDLVDALARVGTLTEQVLVDVADRCRVWVDAGRREEHPLEVTEPPGPQESGHPGLEDAVALHDSSQHLVEPRPVERMGDRRDQSGGGPRWEP